MVCSQAAFHRQAGGRASLRMAFHQALLHQMLYPHHLSEEYSARLRRDAALAHAQAQGEYPCQPLVRHLSAAQPPHPGGVLVGGPFGQLQQLGLPHPRYP